jgi:hypothetical protein
MDRTAILNRYPWLAPHRRPELVVLGDDLDAALSAALYLHTHPTARVVGIYHQYERIYYPARLQWEQVLGAVWLDLDIYHPACRSLGHHILRLTPADTLPGFRNSCNLNDLAGKSLATFREKYPLGTVHFLLWLYELPLPEQPDADLLLWLADSTYLNGQSHRFRENVGRWLQIFPLPWLLAGFEREIDTLAFEQRMQQFQQQVMEPAGFARGHGQARSRHLGLSGYQCQPPETPDGTAVAAHLLRLLAFVAAQTGWTCTPRQLAALSGPLRTQTGQRQQVAVHEVAQEGLAAFLARRGVFSYVFQSASTMNYTHGV